MTKVQIIGSVRYDFNKIIEIPKNEIKSFNEKSDTYIYEEHICIGDDFIGEDVELDICELD